MYLFYPLPVTKDYVRYKKRPGRQDRISVTRERVPEKSTPRSQWYKKKPSIRDRISITRERVPEKLTPRSQVFEEEAVQIIHEGHRLSIWDVMKDTTHPLLLDTLMDATKFVKVSLFHSDERRRRNFEISAAFNHLLILKHEDNHFPPYVESAFDMVYGWATIAEYYKEIDLRSDDSFRGQCDMFYHEGLAKWFKEHMKFIRLIKTPVIPVLPREDITIHHISSLVKQRPSIVLLAEEDHGVFPNWRWLILMSWWRAVQTQFKPFYSQLLKEMKNASKNDIKDTAQRLEEILQELNLNDRSAESIAVDLYMDTELSRPQLEQWKLSELKPANRCLELSGHPTFADVLKAQECDRMWVSFVVETAQLSIEIVNATLSILKVVHWSEQYIRLIQTAIMPLIESFYDSVVREHQTSITRKNCVDMVLKHILRAIKHHTISLREMIIGCWSGMIKGTSEEFLQRPSEFVFKFVDDVIDAAGTHALRGFYPSPSARLRAVRLMISYLRDVKIYGRSFAISCFRNDFLNCQILKQLREQVLCWHRKVIFLKNCSLVAHCILSTHEIIYWRIEKIQRSVALPFDYGISDFTAFVQEICIPFAPLCVVSESICSSYSHRYKAFVRSLNKELRNSLEDVTFTASETKSLLDKVAEKGYVNQPTKNDYISLL